MPLSRRTARAGPDGPYEGVPGHLQSILAKWYESAFDENPPLGYYPDAPQHYMALRMRLEVGHRSNGRQIKDQLLARAFAEPAFFLDLIDATLDQTRDPGLSSGLDEILGAGASVWCVNREGAGLERRVTDEMASMLDSAVFVPDPISDELKLAWAHAYGLHGSPSHAWNHAVVALEHLFIDLVVPNKPRSNLGTALGELKANSGNKWRSIFPGRELNNSVTPVVGALEAVWPNSNRHGGGSGRPPTAAEARSVVAIAVALVQAHRESPVVYKVP